MNARDARDSRDDRDDLGFGRRRDAAAQSINATDAILRTTGVLMLLAIGTIHFLQIVPTTEQTPVLGVAFLGIIAASLAVAVWLPTRGTASCGPQELRSAVRR